uniref:22-kDa protein of chloroplasts in green spores n=1 Tax=Osmunda japonica TaxID=90693 RepID=Q852R0_9MONI|nr:22-kDa protein of chloroplasts in green spores [Osmunda japonica]
MAATAALAVSSDLALAASGPGINIGAQGTAEKANDLLKGAADKLNIQDAPKRFGPGIPGAAKDATKVAQKAGSGAIGDLQAGATDVTRQARQNVEDTARRTGGLFGNAKDNAGGVAGNVQDGAKNILGQVQGKKDDARSAAKDVVGQAQSKANDGKGVLGSIQEGIQGFTESVAQKGSDAKTAAEGAASNAQKALQ